MKRIAVVFSFSAICASASAGPVIQIDKGLYEIGTVTGLLSTYRSTIESQIWYGNSSLAREFSNKLGTLLGMPNFGQLGPMFGYDVYDGVGADYTRSWVYKPSNFHLTPDNRAQNQNAAAGVYYTYAVGTYLGATEVPEPHSILLVALGIGLLFGCRRKAHHLHEA